MANLGVAEPPVVSFGPTIDSYSVDVTPIAYGLALEPIDQSGTATSPPPTSGQLFPVVAK